MARKSASVVDSNKPETIDSLTAELAEILEKLEDCHSEPDLELKLVARRDQIRNKLDVAAVQKLEPLSAQGIPEGSQANFPIAAILVTDNHREKMHDGKTQQMARGFVAGIPLMQPIGIHLVNGSTGRLIWGSRRLAAAMIAGWTEIPATIYPAELSAQQVSMLRSIENMQRAELTPTERALAIADMVEEYEKVNFNSDRKTYDIVETAGGAVPYVAAILGQSAEWIRDHLYIRKLERVVRNRLADGLLDLGHARELAKVQDAELQINLAEQFSRRADGMGGVNVDTARRRVDENLRSLRGVAWKLDVIVEGKDDRLVKSACTVCRFNSKCQPLLFEHQPEVMQAFGQEGNAGICMNPTCFEARTAICTKLLPGLVSKVVTQAKKNDNTVSKDMVIDVAGDSPVRIETIQRKAKSQVDPAKSTKSSSSRSEGDSVIKKDPVRLASDQFESKIGEWQIEAAAEITKKIKAEPVYMVLLNLLCIALGDDLELNEPTYEKWKKPAEAEINYQKSVRAVANLVNQDRVRNAIKAFGTNPGDCLKAIAKIAHFGKEINRWQIENLASPVLVQISNAIGVKLPDPPDRQKMIDDAAGKNSQQADPGKTASKPKKKKLAKA